MANSDFKRPSRQHSFFEGTTPDESKPSAKPGTAAAEAARKAAAASREAAKTVEAEALAALERAQQGTAAQAPAGASAADVLPDTDGIASPIDETLAHPPEEPVSTPTQAPAPRRKAEPIPGPDTEPTTPRQNGAGGRDAARRDAALRAEGGPYQGGIGNTPAAQKRPAQPARRGSKTGRAPTPREKGAKKGGNAITRFFKHMTPLQRNILLASAIFVLILCILLAVLLPSGQGGLPATSLSGPDGSMISETGYNPDEHKLDEGQFQGTVLGVTEDAGMEYCEETLFLGDSNTVRMISYSDVTGATLQNAIGVEGMGIGAVTTNRCVKFEGHSRQYTMPEAVALLQPKRVVITFGTNNVGGTGLDSFISSYREALEAIQDAYPYTDIIIAAVPLVDQYHMNESITMSKIDQYNVALAALADEMDLKFLNWSEAMRDEATGFAKSSYTISDGVHISREGMSALFTYYRTHSYISEDRRPKPLDTIPTRVANPVGLITSDGNTSYRSTTTSSSSLSSSSALTATITFSVKNSEYGDISVGGATYKTYTAEVALGADAPTVQAVPRPGYQFVAWEGTSSQFDRSRATLTYNVDKTIEAGQAVVLTAVFEPIATTSTTTTTSVVPPTTTTTNPDPVTSSDPGTTTSVPDPTPSIPDPTPSIPDPTPSIPDPATSDGVPIEPANAPPTQPAGAQPGASTSRSTAG